MSALPSLSFFVSLSEVGNCSNLTFKYFGLTQKNLTDQNEAFFPQNTTGSLDVARLDHIGEGEFFFCTFTKHILNEHKNNG